MEPRKTYKIHFSEMLGSIFLLLVSIFFFMLNFSAEMRLNTVALIIYNTLGVLFAAVSIMLLRKLAGNTVTVDTDGITQTRFPGKAVCLKWAEIQRAEFKPSGDFLYLYSENAVIFIYPKTEDIHGLLRAVRDNLDEEMTYEALHNLLNSKYIKIDKKKK